MREVHATVTSKGQVTIPVEIRRHLGIDAADKVAFVINGEGRVELRPPAYTLASLRGIVPALKGRETGDFDDLIKEAMEDMADEEVRKLRGR